MVAARSVTVTLRSGVSDATLPNNIKMTGTKTYAISMGDYGKLSRRVRDSVVTSTVNTADTILPRFDGTNFAFDLTSATFHNTAALPPIYTGASKLFSVGDVVQGFNGSVFKLVLLSTDATLGNVNATTTANVAVWLNKAANTVSVKTSAAGNAAADLAGVFIGAVTAGQYGWIQVEGEVSAAAANAIVAAGDPTAVNWATDGQFTTAANEVQTVTLASWDPTDTIKITWDGHESGAVTQASDVTALFQAAFDSVGVQSTAFAGYNAGDCVVTRTSATVYVFTFSGASVRYRDVSAITFTSGTGSATGAVVETLKGKPYGAVSGLITTPATGGTALTASAATKSDVALRASLFARRHIRSRNLFLDKN